MHTFLFQYAPFHDTWFRYLLAAERWLSNTEHVFLKDEWLASAISIVITYLVFVMGIPALIFQTFIPDGLRHIYNERFEKDWGQFTILIQAVLVLFILSNPVLLGLYFDFRLNLIGALVVIIMVTWILSRGGVYFKKRFESMRDIEKQLAGKVVDTALEHIKANNKRGIRKDKEDLAILGKEIPSGSKKDIFLEECERLVEALPKMELKDPRLIGEILRDVVCPSVDFEKEKFDRHNTEKVLEILILVHSQAFNSQNSAYSYLKVEISNLIKDIAIKAVLADDFTSVEIALDKLSLIEAPATVMYDLGSAALSHSHSSAAIAVVTTLRNKVIENQEGPAPANADRHLTESWLGLLSKIWEKKGAAQEFALHEVALVNIPRPELMVFFENAQEEFQSDFATVDALRDFQKAIPRHRRKG
ncbi:MAG: hypothetical protein ACKVUS_08105 [Saprospiraceae bacterium]